MKADKWRHKLDLQCAKNGKRNRNESWMPHLVYEINDKRILV